MVARANNILGQLSADDKVLPDCKRGSAKKESPANALEIDPCKVTSEDLKLTGTLLELLHVLNDEYAGPKPIEKLVAKVPVLQARIIAHAQRRIKGSSQVNLSRALMLVGNAGLETVLFEVLEELTILKADLEEG